MKTLIVKGNRFEAARAAADRGIPLVFVGERNGFGETIGHSNVGEELLNRWFCEPGSAPYATGTLLWWGAAGGIGVSYRSE